MWETAFGVVRTNKELTSRLLTDLSLDENLEAFKREHSIGAIIPFIKYYYPKAQILPILISSYAREADAQRLSQWLGSNLDEESLIVFSMDFSHYLEYSQAQANDQITKGLILGKNIGRIAELNNDYVDSPIGLAACLLLAQDRGLETKIIYQANSADYIKPTPIETTSYFGIVFINNRVL